VMAAGIFSEDYTTRAVVLSLAGRLKFEPTPRAQTASRPEPQKPTTAQRDVMCAVLIGLAALELGFGCARRPKPGPQLMRIGDFAAGDSGWSDRAVSCIMRAVGTSGTTCRPTSMTRKAPHRW
jgi:hypothetical protein